MNNNSTRKSCLLCDRMFCSVLVFVMKYPGCLRTAQQTHQKAQNFSSGLNACSTVYTYIHKYCTDRFCCLRLIFWHYNIENYLRFSFVLFFLLVWLCPCFFFFFSPEYAQFHKQLQKQLCDKYVLKIHHLWQVSLFLKPKLDE